MAKGIKVEAENYKVSPWSNDLIENAIEASSCYNEYDEDALERELRLEIMREFKDKMLFAVLGKERYFIYKLHGNAKYSSELVGELFNTSAENIRRRVMNIRKTIASVTEAMKTIDYDMLELNDLMYDLRELEAAKNRIKEEE